MISRKRWNGERALADLRVDARAEVKPEGLQPLPRCAFFQADDECSAHGERSSVDGGRHFKSDEWHEQGGIAMTDRCDFGQGQAYFARYFDDLASAY